MEKKTLTAPKNLLRAIKRRGWEFIAFEEVGGQYHLTVHMPATSANDKEKLHDFRTYWGYIGFAIENVDHVKGETVGVMFYTL